MQKAGKNRVLKEIRKIICLVDVYYMRQKNQKGLDDAIACAGRRIVDELFELLYNKPSQKQKNPCTKQLIDTFNKYEKSTLSLNVISNDKLNKYEIIEGAS